MRRLQELETKEKKTLLRVDFNVTFGKDGKIVDDYRLIAAKPTLEYLLGQRACIILLTHLSQETVFNQGDEKANKLEKIAQRTAEIIRHQVEFIPGRISPEIKKLVAAAKPGEVILLDNLRNNEGEEKNSLSFAQELAALGEVFVNDAFGVCHRNHASIVSLSTLLPSAAGFLIQKETEWLTRVLQEKNLSVVIGGAKISTKLKLIKKFLASGAEVLAGGALANNLFQLKGFSVGRSLVEKNLKENDFQGLNLANPKLHLPVDVVVATDLAGQNKKTKSPDQVADEELILDIGPETEKLFARVIGDTRAVIWNGPLGYFENDEFLAGTKAVAEVVAHQQLSVVGGGETVSCLHKLNLADKFSFVSTGGGAMMDFLVNKTLPGLAALGFKSDF